MPLRRQWSLPGRAACLTHDLWTDLSSRTEQFLSQHTPASLVVREGVQDVAARQRADQRKDARSPPCSLKGGLVMTPLYLDYAVTTPVIHGWRRSWGST